MTAPVDIQPDPGAVTGTEYAEDLAFNSNTYWEGVLVVEGVETGDGRQFALNSITWAQLPIPLRRNIEDSHGGDMATTTAVLVGRIDMVWRDEANPAVIRGAGVFDDGGEQGAEAVRLVREGFLRGVSVDPDSIKDADVELVFPDEGSEPDQLEDIMMMMMPELTIFHAGRLRAATLVDIPAFVEAQIGIVDRANATAPVTASSHFAQISRRPWVVGTMEARVNGLSAITKAYAHPHAEKLHARLLHHEVTEDGEVGLANLTAVRSGIRALTSGRVTGLTASEQMSAYSHLVQHLRDAGIHDEQPRLEVAPSAVTAALEVLEGPPSEWFNWPEPDGFMAPTVTDAVTAGGWRQFIGHGAAWGTCHLSYPGACREVPHEGEHAYFRTGEVLCADGSRVAVGSITMATGHAPTTPGTSALKAVEHYDNTGAVVALVATMEGKHGIWMMGAIPPWVSPDRVAALQASGQVSGDWRGIGGKLRLVAFLAVNHGGFPVPRLKVTMSHGRQTSLIAAGLYPQAATQPPQSRAALERIARSIGRDNTSRAAELRRRVKGE